MAGERSRLTVLKELKVVGAYNQNFENKPSQLLNKSINEK